KATRARASTSPRRSRHTTLTPRPMGPPTSASRTACARAVHSSVDASKGAAARAPSSTAARTAPRAYRSTTAFAIATKTTRAIATAVTYCTVVMPACPSSDAELATDPVDDVEAQRLEHRPDRHQRGDAERGVPEQLSSRHAHVETGEALAPRAETGGEDRD